MYLELFPSFPMELSSSQPLTGHFISLLPSWFRFLTFLLYCFLHFPNKLSLSILVSGFASGRTQIMMGEVGGRGSSSILQSIWITSPGVVLCSSCETIHGSSANIFTTSFPQQQNKKDEKVPYSGYEYDKYNLEVTVFQRNKRSKWL